MRLYSPAWTLSMCVASERTMVGGRRIDKGELIMLSQWVTHRDPRLFPEPLRFHPERWEAGLERRLSRFAYFPFGGGQRLCISQSFAMMEVTLILAAIVGRFRVEL